MKEQDNKTKWLHLRMSEEEHKSLIKAFRKSTCRKLAEYARKALLAKPVVGSYRNQSLDDFMAEMIRLRNELSAVGNNFNQAVKKLHTLDRSQQVEQWMIVTEMDRRSLQRSIESIEKTIGKIADQWLR